jgi:hypothetical protein
LNGLLVFRILALEQLEEVVHNTAIEIPTSERCVNRSENHFKHALYYTPLKQKDFAWLGTAHASFLSSF